MLKRHLLNIVFASLVLAAGSAHAAEPRTLDAVAPLQHEWAKTTYLLPPGQQEAAFKTLADKAAQVSQANPGKAESLIWEAIILSGYAKAKGGLGALDLVSKARDLLLQAEKADPNALDGSVYTSLGSLYYKVPGWPISFGSKQKAREYLEKALKINPTGIDPNYFYGDFLAEQGEYAKAMEHFKRALNAPPRPERADADTGRRKDITEAMEKTRRQL